VVFPDGAQVPALGFGTWRMGESARTARGGGRCGQAGLELGMTLIDTAEMYGDGGAEAIVGEAIAGAATTVFIVSKVYPHNAGAKSAIAACARSLKRLAPIASIAICCTGAAAFRWPKRSGVRALRPRRARSSAGASPISTSTTWTSLGTPRRRTLRANQVLYHLGERGSNGSSHRIAAHAACR
jgi:aryl-alcohol dehydrogenase-like predicted oxidoreductase